MPYGKPERKEFDFEAARVAVSEAEVQIQALRETYPECMQKLAIIWNTHLMTCGHKALGNLVRGRTAQEATRKWDAAERRHRGS